MTETTPPNEEPIDMTTEFAALKAKRDADNTALTKSFIESGLWLAQQKDPFQQLLRITQQEHMKTFAQKLEANQQFGEIAKTGKTDATRIFDLMMGMYAYNIDPEKFFKTIQTYEDSQKTGEPKNIVIKVDKDGKQVEKIKFDLKDLIKDKEFLNSFDPSGSMQEPKSSKPFNQEEFNKKLEEILKKLPRKNREENESNEENKI